MSSTLMWHGQFMTFPPAEMVAMVNGSIGEGLRVFIGVAEILAAIGLIPPGLTRILPSLTVLAYRRAFAFTTCGTPVRRC